MELLESFDSYFYVLINTLPVSIGIGFLFFGVGFLLTNPRVKRYRQQIEHYKEECARMSRNLASINHQHKELLENVQGKEQENLLLQTTLESKDEELIGLLDRLNSIATDSTHSEPFHDRREEDGAEVRMLRHQITELSGRLKTSESALRDRKSELAQARQQLSSVGVEMTAGSSGGGGGGIHNWSPLASHGSNHPGDSAAIMEPGEGEDDANESFAPDDERDQETEPAKNDAGAQAKEASPEKQSTFTLQPAKTDETESIGAESAEAEAEAAKIETAPESVSSASPAPADVELPATSDGDEPAAESLEDVFGGETAELEDQLADFEERLRKKEAEFFALQEQLSFGSLDSSATEPSPDEATAPSDSVEDADAETATTPAASPIAAFPPLTPDAASSPSQEKDTADASTSVAAAPASTDQAVLFRGDDPSLWGKVAGIFTIKPADAPEGMNFLRLRREDTGQSVIISLGKKDLLAMAPSENVLGWNGKGETFEGAHHLGIFDHSLPQEVETRFGAGGWGFGHFYGKRSGQAYCWNGIAIEKTGFEISVLNRLPDAETLRQTDTLYLDNASVPPSEGAETVFFRSAYPEIWNKNVVDGRGGFALNLCRAPRDTRFVKVTRVDTGLSVIIPVTREKLGGKMEEKKALGWNGSNEFFFGGHHLGICDPESANDVEIKYGCGGYGFGHLVDANDTQAFAWGGKAIGQTAFEFTAIARDLTDEETTALLTV